MSLVFAPASKAQEQFLTSESDITFYGGAAGAGKSHCLLGSFLKFAYHPRTRGVIFRRTTKQLSNPGGLFDSAINLYKQVDPKLKIRMRDLELEFSTGATLKFAYLDKPSDRYNFQGAELTYIGFDEIQQLSEENVTYLFSRLRSTTVDYKKQIVATGNPDYDSFIRPWVEFALDERGIPVRKEVYPARYMVQVEGGGIQWADTREELEELYGKNDDSGILSFTFIPGTIYDNPPLMKADPTYVSKLKSLPRVEMERLLLGSWYARPEAAGHFKTEWVEIVGHPNVKATKRVRAWDLAATLPSQQYPNPDWTRGVLMSKDKDSIYTVEDVVSLRDRVQRVEELIFNTAFQDGHGVTIVLPQDPGAAGTAYAKNLQRKLAEMGFSCRLIKPHKSKLTRFAPFSSIAQAGFVRVVRGEWNKSYFDELETFDENNRKLKDDQVDATSDCIFILNQQLMIPDFTMPDFTGSNPFNFSGGGTGNIVAAPTFNF